MGGGWYLLVLSVDGLLLLPEQLPLLVELGQLLLGLTTTSRTGSIVSQPRVSESVCVLSCATLSTASAFFSASNCRFSDSFTSHWARKALSHTE